MKPVSFFAILFCLFGCLSSAVAQVQETSTPLFFEKVYLHTDREVYGQGEDIWFKAYVVNAQNNAPINYSHNLYVELISPDAKVVHREMVRLEDGLGNGDFKLSDTIASGHYRLRAYTNWMRNFGDNFVFEKNLTVLQTGEVSKLVAAAAKKKVKSATASATAILSSVPSAAASTLPVVRFFPEGGDLVNGLVSVIGVKAEDANGNGIPASGKVVNNTGEVLGSFSCDSLGFGSFVLLPALGQHYQALVSLQGTEQRFILPDVRAGGFGMQVRYLGADTVKVIVGTTAVTVGQHLYLVARHSGKSYVRQAVVLNGDHVIVSIPNSQLPEGISAITLYNEQNQPECERLIYIQHPDLVKLRVSTDQPAYAPKGVVKVSLKLGKPERAHLSMVAVDADMVPVQTENIVSYLNLQSEIKGRIESPGRYFDSTNVNRFKQLDLLLLTQGWRGFVWKKLADTALNITYQPEQGITLTGRVRRVGANKPLSGIDVTMRAPKADGQKLFWATTDSSGRFAIYDTKFYGYQYLSFTSRKGNKINRDGESKGNSGGYIQVDSLSRDTLPVRPVASILPVDTSWKTRQQADAAIERIKKALNLKASHNLKEVTIKANTSRLYTTLPPEIHPITLVEQKEYDNLEQYLLYMVEGSEQALYRCSGCMSDKDTSPLVPRLWQKGKGPIPIRGSYVDKSAIGCPCQNEYLDQPMRNVLKVTINRIEDVYGKHISVNIVLRPGVLNGTNYFDNTVADVTGYYKAREFYKPNGAKPDDIDLRTNTIHWEPNITTNDNGEATVTFYNTAQTGKIRLITEGITTNGKPIATAAVYEVK